MSFTQASAFLVDKGKHRHFMAKEIAEQPEVVGHTLAEYVDFAERTVRLPKELTVDFAKLDRLTITACGTASYAGLIAKYWFERIARLPTEVDIASEFRYREAPLTKGGLVARHLAVGRDRRHAGGAALLQGARSAHAGHRQCAGVDDRARGRSRHAAPMPAPRSASPRPRPSPASSPCLRCWRSPPARRAVPSMREKERELVGALIEAPRHMAEILKEEKHIADIAREVAHARDVLYLGRGINYPIALEGALKLKEISYIHAEGYAAGELKHGPIALIDENVPVIVIAPATISMRRRSPTWRRWRRAAARSCS